MASITGGAGWGGARCEEMKTRHVGVFVKGWTWIPDSLDGVYTCRCGVSCVWSKAAAVVDRPDALLFEGATPPLQAFGIGCMDKEEGDEGWSGHAGKRALSRLGLGAAAARVPAPWGAGQSSGVVGDVGRSMGMTLGCSASDMIGLVSLDTKLRMKGLPLRVYLDLEASRKPTGFEDIFIGYHANDDLQVTYAGKSFHTSRSYHVSTEKTTDALIYWSSSRCLPHRDKLAEDFLSLVPHHSFGKCLNNVGGPDMALSMYPICSNNGNGSPHWWDHLHCAMSHYKFVLAIENTKAESYVTEKLFYALEAGSVPIYFGAPNVWDFIPPNSAIDASKFSSLKELASYVKALANDPVAYAEYHAWRRCGVLGNFCRTREMSLDTLPCRLCELVSKRGGRSADSF
ncbi:Alpha-(1,4)-fucosyltransferase [Triticum urartu]|uniref:Fucosyltransferase n=1 Tax=Triticum urartu TaxID=4572 RepID=M8ALF2_TRIUA|nr:Alpha-(1,4)-fucosyltransferase [Triticum urartu]